MEVGDTVEVILSKDWVMILEVSNDMFNCRTKDGRIIEFHRFELKNR